MFSLLLISLEIEHISGMGFEFLLQHEVVGIAIPADAVAIR